jgi:hypothetical protein
VRGALGILNPSRQEHAAVGVDRLAGERYTSYEVALNRRYGNNWQFRASFSGTKKTEPFGTSDNTAIARLDPNI